MSTFCYGATYAGFQDVSADLQNEGLLSFDLTYVFDPEYRLGEQEIFFDYCHVNHYANEIVAEQIFLDLKPILDQR